MIVLSAYTFTFMAFWEILIFLSYFIYIYIYIYISVSYTHLDVYKRQCMWTEIIKIKKAIKNNKNLTNEQTEICVSPLLKAVKDYNYRLVNCIFCMQPWFVEY